MCQSKSTIHLPVVLSVSCFHILEAIAEPLDRCLEQCFHLFHLLARHVFFSQHGCMLLSLVFQQSDLSGVIALACQRDIYRSQTFHTTAFLTHVSTAVEGLFTSICCVALLSLSCGGHAFQVSEKVSMESISHHLSSYLQSTTCSPVLPALR